MEGFTRFLLSLLISAVSFVRRSCLLLIYLPDLKTFNQMLQLGFQSTDRIGHQDADLAN